MESQVYFKEDYRRGKYCQKLGKIHYKNKVGKIYDNEHITYEILKPTQEELDLFPGATLYKMCDDRHTCVVGGNRHIYSQLFPIQNKRNKIMGYARWKSGLNYIPTGSTFELKERTLKYKLILEDDLASKLTEEERELLDKYNTIDVKKYHLKNSIEDMKWTHWHARSFHETSTNYHTHRQIMARLKRYYCRQSRHRNKVINMSTLVLDKPAKKAAYPNRNKNYRGVY